MMTQPGPRSVNLLPSLLLPTQLTPTSTRTTMSRNGLSNHGRSAPPALTKVCSCKKRLSLVYIGATMNQALPQSYIDENNAKTEKQIVLAAHRLAKTIEMIFNPKQDTSTSDAFLQ